MRYALLFCTLIAGGLPACDNPDICPVDPCSPAFPCTNANEVCVYGQCLMTCPKDGCPPFTECQIDPASGVQHCVDMDNEPVKICEPALLETT